jgi:hypothetical protein
MPQVGYGICCYGIIFRCPALFNFAHVLKSRVSERKRPQLGARPGGTRAGASSPGDAIGGNASSIRNKRSQGSNSVCAVSDSKPEKSPLSTARNRTAVLEV